MNYVHQRLIMKKNYKELMEHLNLEVFKFKIFNKKKVNFI